jgi:agmatinase
MSRKPSQRNPQPLDPLSQPRFGGIATFSRLPYVPDIKGKKIDVAILGVPFDGGTTFRPGARFAPRAVRDASVLCRNFNPTLGVNIFEKLAIVDAGDIATVPMNIQKTFESIENHESQILDQGTRIVSIGGDHSILLPELRAFSQKHQDFVLIQFDAHTDTGDQAWGEKYHHGTPIRRLIEEEILTGDQVFQIGIRGPLTSQSQETYVRDQKIQILEAEALDVPGACEAFFKKLRKKAGNKPCFITFDVDGVDPAYAPGTGTPVVGGLTSREALSAVRALRGLNIQGANVVEISPPYDQSDLTSLLGAALIFEFLSLMALSPASKPSSQRAKR